MKTWMIVMFAVGIGLVAGTGASFWQLGLPGSGDPLDAADLLQAGEGYELAPSTKGGGRLVVALRKDGQLQEGVTDVDFGVLPEGSRDGAEFVFFNRGAGPLQIMHKREDSSCKCTLADFGDRAEGCKQAADQAPGNTKEVAPVLRKTIEPGGELVVRLCWLTEHAGAPFSHRATIRTNDANRPKVRLTVRGKVTQPLSVDSVVSFGEVHHRATTSKSFRCRVYHLDDLQIKSVTVVDPEFAEFLELTSQRKLAKQELIDRAIRDGYELTLTLKPGLPLGAFEKTIRLATNAAADAYLRVTGVVVGDITVARGGGWLRGIRVFSLGQVDGRQGKARTMYLLVRGPQRNEIQIHGVKTIPKALRASIGKPVRLENLVRWPVKIEIPPGTPAMNHAGRGSYAKIILDTNHPDEKQLTLNVSFGVN